MRTGLRHLRFVALLVLVGCNALNPTPAAQVPTLEPATQAPPQSSPAPAEARPCFNEYLPVVKGANWTYEGTTSQGDYSEYAIILEVQDDRFEIAVSMADVSYQESWLCTSEGLVQWEDPTSPFTAFFAGPDNTASIFTTDTEGVTLPTTFGVGDEWSQTTQFEISGDKYAGPSTLSHEFSADRAIEVTVAGTVWLAVVVSVTSRMEVQFGPQFAIEFESTQWYVPGVGLVKLEGNMGQWEVGNQVVEPGSEYDVSYELVGYSIP